MIKIGVLQMDHRQPGKHARDSQLTDVSQDGIKPTAWVEGQAVVGQVPAPRVSMELLERLAFLLRRC
jgi:hypothetical protein